MLLYIYSFKVIFGPKYAVLLDEAVVSLSLWTRKLLGSVLLMSEMVLVMGIQCIEILGITTSGACRSGADVWPIHKKKKSRSFLNNKQKFLRCPCLKTFVV